MKQIPFCALFKGSFSLLQHIINTYHHISNISYSPRIVWHQNKSVIPTKEHSNHYLQNVFISTVTIYKCLDNQYTIELVISGIAGLTIWSCYASFK